MNIIVAVVTPLLGLSIIVFCLLSFRFRYGDNFKDKIQKIRGFGLDLQVSVLTLFVLVGLAMFAPAFYVWWNGYEEQLSEIEQEYENRLKTTRDRIAVLERQIRGEDVMTYITLQGSNQMPRLEDVNCEYYVLGKPDPIKVDVSKGVLPLQFALRLTDITRTTQIQRLVLTELSTGVQWSLEGFAPLIPEYELRREE